jgi:hypothetical protein
MSQILKQQEIVDKKCDDILEQEKHIKESIYLQERFHRGH